MILNFSCYKPSSSRHHECVAGRCCSTRNATNDIVVTKQFIRETLNNRISSFCYSTSEARDRPTPITYQDITKESSLKQSCKYYTCTNLYLLSSCPNVDSVKQSALDDS